MEESFREVAAGVALAIEAIVVLVVAWGAVQALIGSIGLARVDKAQMGDARREIWFGFATWIVLALEFALAADIIRSAIAPTWDSIGQLGAIAAIRTLLNYFLMKDINEYNERRVEREARRTAEADGIDARA